MSYQKTVKLLTLKKLLTHFLSLGDAGRISRSEEIEFAHKLIQKSLTVVEGTAQGTPKKGIVPLYNTQVVVGKGFICDCVDHKNLIRNCRKTPSPSPCKHVLALCRMSLAKVEDMLCTGLDSGGFDITPKVIRAEDLSTGLSIEKEILYG